MKAIFERPEGQVDLRDSEKMKIGIAAKDFAMQVRRKLGINPTDAVDILQLLENQGIVVLQIMELGSSGFLRIMGKEKVIFLNASEPLGRQHYTAAHEFCHILRDLEIIKQIQGLPQEQKKIEYKKMEYFAFKFADYFLMSEPAVADCLDALGIYDFSTISVNDILRIQQHFRVSYRQVTRMLNKYNVISDTARQELNAVSSEEDPERLIRVTREAGFPTELITPLKESQLPERFRVCLLDNIKNGRITRRKVHYLSNLLRLPSLLDSIPEVGYDK